MSVLQANVKLAQKESVELGIRGYERLLGEPMASNDGPLNLLDNQTPTMGIRLNQWLLGATNGNQGHTVMDLGSSETIKHP